MEQIGPWLWIAAIAVVFWLLIIRPASKRQREAASLQSGLSVGDDVMLTSGIFATVISREDDHLVVEVSPGVTLRVVPGAVASVRREEPSEESESDADSTDAESTEGGDQPTDPTNEER